MVFPKSNLSTAAQPWGRFVEKSITNLETTVATERVNNAARDAQASLSIKRLDQSVTAVAAATAAAQQAADDAQAAIDGLTSLGSIDSDYTINAGNINAGTLTGVTVQTADAGTRVVMSGTTIDLYHGTSHVGQILGTDASGAAEASFVVPGTGVGFNDGIYISEGAAFLKFGNASLNLDTASSALRANSGAAAFEANNDNTSEIYGALTVHSAATLSSTLTVTGSSTLKNDIFYESRPASSVIGTPIHVRTSGASTNLLFDYTSSRKYKSDIVDLEIDYDKFTSVPVRSFIYKGDETEYGPNAQRGYGYIAEELDEAGFTDLVVYRDTEDGGFEPHSLAFHSISAVTQAIVNKQAEMIKQLQAQVESLNSAVAELQSKVQ